MEMNRINQGRIIGLLVLLLLGLTSGEAAVYRWVDADGRTQFGDRPPVDHSAQEIQIRSAPASGVQSAPVTEQQRRELRQKMLDAYQEEREQKREAREKQAAAEARRKRACVEAKNRLLEYKDASVLYELQPDGSRRFLTDAEYQASLRQAEDEVKRVCRRGE